MKERYLLFGGSFNPPQNGHMLLAKEILSRVSCDKFFIIPSADRHDKVISTSGIDRLKMLQLAVDECLSEFKEKIEISDTEIKRDRPTATYETLDEFKNRFPNVQILFVVGSDILGEIRTKWQQGEYMYHNGNFLAYPRGGFSLNGVDIPSNVEFIDATNLPTKEVSSTEVREKVKTGESIELLVPHSVLEYIQKNQLYKH